MKISTYCTVPTALGLAGLLSLSGPVMAERTFQMEGTVFIIDDWTRFCESVPYPFPNLAIGDPISLTYTFDETTQDAFPLDDNRGTYAGAILGYHLQLGEYQWSSPEWNNQQSSIDVRRLSNHEYRVNIYYEPQTFILGGDPAFLYIEAFLSDRDQLMLTDDTLPTSPPNGFEGGGFSLTLTNSPGCGVVDWSVISADLTISDNSANFLAQDLIQEVIQVNLDSGISNSLDNKLDSAVQALEDSNDSNDAAAIQALEAFINSVEAQRGKKISDADADALIEAALEIISTL